MKEIRLNSMLMWENENIEATIGEINFAINYAIKENYKNTKIVLNLPLSYFDETLFDSIIDSDAIEFESKDGRRFNKEDIILVNNKFKKFLSGIDNSKLSQFEKFIIIYSIVINYKPYKDGNEKYLDIGRSPYLFLEDDYINCFGICQFLCILCRKAGINIGMFKDIKTNHAVCYYYIKDNKYGIDGYFMTDPTHDIINDKKECNYSSMLKCIIFNNDFESFLNSDRQLFLFQDDEDISLFSECVSLLKPDDYFVANRIEMLYSFREQFRKKENFVSYDVIYSCIQNVSQYGYNLGVYDEIMLKNALFLNNLKEKKQCGESTDELIKSFIESSIDSLVVKR